MHADRSALAQSKYRSRMRVWWVSLVLVILLVVGVVTVTVLMFLGHTMTLLHVMHDGPSTRLSQADEAILLRIDDLLAEEEMPAFGAAEYSGREPREDGGVVLFVESARRIHGGEIRIHCSAHFTRDASSARETFSYLSAADNVGRRHVDESYRLSFTPVLTPERLAWGEKSELVDYLLDGRPAGFQFTALAGNRVYLVAVSGRNLSDPNLLRMLLLPKLEKFAVYEP